jgi:2-desacetyl-2-hydroxyethyl bacteriochlorophyllide A dehydrogenase
MRAVLLHRPGAVDIVDRPEPRPGPEDVIVEVSTVGLCATDVHIYDGQLDSTAYPIVPGHEFAGRIAEVGTRVTQHAVGDLIAADCTLSCGRCSYCRSGRHNLCANCRAIGDAVDGGLAEYVSVPTGNVYAWPGNVPHELATLTEPLACVVHGMDRLGPVLGATALVVGTGVMGALAGHLLRTAGVRTLHACELNERRRTCAETWADRTMGALYAVDGHVYDVVVDATGSASAIEQSIATLAPGGRFLLLGAAPPAAFARISPYEVLKRELTLIGSMSKQYSFQPALDLLAAGNLDLCMLLEEPVPLSSYGAAIENVRRGVGMKTVLAPS